MSSRPPLHALAAVLLAAACRNSAPLPHPDPPAPSASDPDFDDERDAAVPNDVHFNFDHADLIELMHAFTMVVDRPVVVDPAAYPRAACATITMRSPDAVPTSRLPAHVDQALAPAGLALRASPGGFIVELRPGAASGEDDAGSRCAHAHRDYLFSYPPMGAAPAATGDTVAAGIREVSETEREITEAARRALAADFASTALEHVRIVFEERRPRIFGLQPGDVLTRLGLRAGDRVVSFGEGLDASPAAALRALHRMRNGREAVIGIERTGARLDLRYRVVP